MFPFAWASRGVPASASTPMAATPVMNANFGMLQPLGEFANPAVVTPMIAPNPSHQGMNFPTGGNDVYLRDQVHQIQNQMQNQQVMLQAQIQMLQQQNALLNQQLSTSHSTPSGVFHPSPQSHADFPPTPAAPPPHPTPPILKLPHHLPLTLQPSKHKSVLASLLLAVKVSTSHARPSGPVAPLPKPIHSTCSSSYNTSTGTSTCHLSLCTGPFPALDPRHIRLRSIPRSPRRRHRSSSRHGRERTFGLRLIGVGTPASP